MGKQIVIEDFGDSYNSDVIEERFNKVTPQKQEATDYKMRLAAKIYTAFKQKGLTQTQFAEAMDKQVSVISKWLIGTHNFTVDTLTAIQRVLDVRLIDVDELMENVVAK